MSYLQRVSGILIVFLVLTLVYTNTVSKNQGVQCDEDETGVTLARSVDIAGDSSEEVTVNLRLQSAAGPRDFSIQYFLNGVQLFVGEDDVLLDCGESKQVRHVLPIEPNEGASLVVFFRQLPIIPNSYVGKTAEQVLAESGAASAAYDFVDSETAILNGGAELDETQFSDTNQTYIENPDRISYLFTWPEQEDQSLVVNLTDDVYDFGLYFGEPSEDSEEVFTFTCMLNDKQIEAFDGSRTWTGKLADKNGVVLRGEVEVIEEGWHQLRCVSLNSMYATPDTLNYYPYTILSTYLYRSEVSN